jgi:hypothetical protein
MIKQFLFLGALMMILRLKSPPNKTTGAPHF